MPFQDGDNGEMLTGLLARPDLAAIVGPESAALVWNEAADRILWASPRARALAEAIGGADGRVSPALPAAARLRALAAGAAPSDSTRLEKLKLDTNGLAPLATLACRRATLPSGEGVLITALIGPVPKLRALPRPPAPESEPVVDGADHAPDKTPRQLDSAGSHGVEQAESGPGMDQSPHEASGAEPFVEAQAEIAPAGEPQAPEPEAQAAPVPPHPPVRFVWQADADARFQAVTDSLAAVVGAGSADIVGRGWLDLLGGIVVDPHEIITDLLVRRETWSGRSVHWRIDGTDTGIVVDLAGMPVFDRGRVLVGYRGFGICRPDIIVTMPPLPAAADVEATIDEPAVPVPDESEESVGDPAPEMVSDPLPAEPEEVPGEIIDDSLPAHGETSLAETSPVETSPAEAAEPAGPEVNRDAQEAVEASDVAEPPVGDADEHHLQADLPDLDHEDVPEPSAVDRPAEEPSAAEPVEEALGEPGYAPVEDETPVLGSGPDHQDNGAPPEPSELESAASPDSSAQDAGTAAAVSPEPSSLSIGSVSGRISGRLGEPQPVPLRAVEKRDTATPPDDGAKARASAAQLSSSERTAFREIARALGARFAEDESASPAPAAAEPDEPAPVPPPLIEAAPPEMAGAADAEALAIIDRLPAGILIHRGEEALFTNRSMLDLLGYRDLAEFQDAGGLSNLFRSRPGALSRIDPETASALTVTSASGEALAVEIKLTTIVWGGLPASLMQIRKLPDADPASRLRALELDLRSREARLREQSAILDTATDGVIVIDDLGRILSLNRSAEALFGYDQNEVTGEPLTLLLATESHIAALDYLEGLRQNGVASLLNDGREVLGRVRQGGVIPLFMTLGRVSDGPERKFCAVLRDITAFKKAEGELLAAKRAAEHASAQKSDFLAKISHEVRTPLNAIIGFAEVMLEERFGPVANERYRDYLSDIHASGQHVISLVNDLLDLAKIEAGRMELSFSSVKLNELVTACVALMQPHAVRDRIVMRTSFSPKLPPVVADERSLRQIVLNLLSNAVKFTDAGGQVIVSTALTDRGEVVLRVRDTGIGMTDTEIEAALEPFRQLSTSRKGGGTGLGLPLTKALVEANRGALQIASTKDEGTLVEVVFPPTRVLAE